MEKQQLFRHIALNGRVRFINQHSDLLGALRDAPAYHAVANAAHFVGVLAREQRHARCEWHRYTRLKYERRRILWLQHVKPLAAIARECLTHSPRLAQLTPHNDSSYAAFTAAAVEAARAASHHKKSFMRQHVPARFVLGLRAATAALAEATTAQRVNRLRITAVTRELTGELGAVTRQSRILDALVESRIAGDDGLRAAWRAARRTAAVLKEAA